MIAFEEGDEQKTAHTQSVVVAQKGNLGAYKVNIKV